MPKAKYIPDKFVLQTLNKEAIKRGYNQVIEPTAFDRIQEARYPITQSLLHSDDKTVRCRLVLGVTNDKPDTVLLDIDVGKFNALPEYDTETGQFFGDAFTFLRDYMPKR